LSSTAKPSSAGDQTAVHGECTFTVAGGVTGLAFDGANVEVPKGSPSGDAKCAAKVPWCAANVR
jgi:hypothetical protein